MEVKVSMNVSVAVKLNRDLESEVALPDLEGFDVETRLSVTVEGRVAVIDSDKWAGESESDRVEVNAVVTDSLTLTWFVEDDVCEASKVEVDD